MGPGWCFFSVWEHGKMIAREWLIFNHLLYPPEKQRTDNRPHRPLKQGLSCPKKVDIGILVDHLSKQEHVFIVAR